MSQIGCEIKPELFPPDRVSHSGDAVAEHFRVGVTPGFAADGPTALQQVEE